MMQTVTMTLTEFLLARIAEDEATICEESELGAEFVIPPRRMLAECEAKRRLVERLAVEVDLFQNPQPGVTYNPHGNLYILGLEVACRELAAVHAEHPDYREEWTL